MQQEFRPNRRGQKCTGCKENHGEIWYRHIPVVFDKNITGMITDRDIDTKILAKGLDPEKARVSNGMTE